MRNVWIHTIWLCLSLVTVVALVDRMAGCAEVVHTAPQVTVTHNTGELE